MLNYSGDSGFRRYLKTVSAEHFAIDETRVAEDARFDGLYVLRTNTKLTPLQVMLRYHADGRGGAVGWPARLPVK